MEKTKQKIIDNCRELDEESMLYSSFDEMSEKFLNANAQMEITYEQDRLYGTVCEGMGKKEVPL